MYQTQAWRTQGGPIFVVEIKNVFTNSGAFYLNPNWYDEIYTLSSSKMIAVSCRSQGAFLYQKKIQHNKE